MQLDSRRLKAESQAWSGLVDDHNNNSRTLDKTTFSITVTWWLQKFPSRDHIIAVTVTGTSGTDPQEAERNQFIVFR